MIFYSDYASSEAGAIVAPHLQEEKVGYYGKLVPNTEARVVDIHTGKDLGPNQVGEMFVKTPSVRIKYHAVNSCSTFYVS